MTADPARFGVLLLAGLSIIVLCGAFVASGGLFIVDEAVTYAGVQSFAERGSLAVQNGWEAFGSPDLLLFHLAEGPRGLVTQYPSGPALVGAPFFAAMDARGLIVLNAAAVVATLWLTRALALLLYQRHEIANAAALILFASSFLLEYAYGVWPHGLSLMCITGALWLAVKAEDGDRVRHAIGSGLLIGLGMSFRTDTVLILPIIGAHILLFAARPWRLIGGGALGLAPMIALLSWQNWIKFGTLNPVSYGKSAGGGIDPSSHLGPIGLLALVALALLLRRQVARLAPLWVLLGVGMAAAVAALALVPELRHFGWRYLRGAWTLFVDITILHDGRPGIVRLPEGIVSFWGLWKKALGQSLPWLGGALFGLVYLWRPPERRGHALVILALALFTLPFVIRAWHGGLGSNLRYFLPLLPLLAMAAAWVWIDLKDRAAASVRAPLLGAALALGLVFGWAALMPSGLPGAMQILSTWLLAAIALAVIAERLVRHRSTALVPLARAAMMAGFVAAFLFGAVFDLSLSQQRRSTIAQSAALYATLPGPSLMVGPPEAFVFQLARPDGLMAMPSEGAPLDIALLERAIEAGYRVYAMPAVAGMLEGSELTSDGTVIEAPFAPLIELVRQAP